MAALRQAGSAGSPRHIGLAFASFYALAQTSEPFSTMALTLIAGNLASGNDFLNLPILPADEGQAESAMFRAKLTRCATERSQPTLDKLRLGCDLDLL